MSLGGDWRMPFSGYYKKEKHGENKPKTLYQFLSNSLSYLHWNS